MNSYKSLGPKDESSNDIAYYELGEGMHLESSSQVSSSPLREVVTYTAPAAFGTIAGIAAFLAKLGAAAIIFSTSSAVILFFLIWAIREFQVTRNLISQTSLDVHSNSLAIQRIATINKQNLALPNVETGLPFGALEVYMQYRSLEVADLASLLDSISRLYKLVYVVNMLEEGKLEMIRSKEDVYFEADSLLRMHPDDRLQLIEVHTGESIKFVISNNTSELISYKDGDYTVALPKAVLSTIMVGAMAFGGAEAGLGLYKTYKETNKTDVETEKAQKEIIKLEYELEELKTKAKKCPIANEEMNKEIENLKNVTTRNKNMTGVKVRTGIKRPMQSRSK